MESSKTKKNKHICVSILFSVKMEIFSIYCLTRGVGSSINNKA